MLTILSNLGKMFPAFCYRKEAHWRHRLAVAIGMWPRGEVGAGVLVLSLSYGIGGPVVTVAMLSLALNLALTGVFHPDRQEADQRYSRGAAGFLIPAAWASRPVNADIQRRSSSTSTDSNVTSSCS